MSWAKAKLNRPFCIRELKRAASKMVLKSHIFQAANLESLLINFSLFRTDVTFRKDKIFFLHNYLSMEM